MTDPARITDGAARRLPGETPDRFTADLAVGRIESGAPARGERVTRYDRLVEIPQRPPEPPNGLA